MEKNCKTDWKRSWIPAIGFILAIGFTNNLIIHPFIHPFFNSGIVEWSGLITAFGVMIGISGARDYFMKVTPKTEAADKQSFGKGWKRLWIPIVGWIIAGGFFVNCAIAPYCSCVSVNDWTQLVAALVAMLGISGARDVSLNSKIDKEPMPEPQDETPKNEDISLSEDSPQNAPWNENVL